MVEVAKSDNGLTTKEIGERVGIGPEATHRLLHTLVGAGMLTRPDRSRYVLGLRAGTLAEGFARQLAPAGHLAPIVRELAQRTGETSYGSGWWADEITVLTVSRGSNPVHAAEVSQGHNGDAHARASGKTLLAFATPEVRRGYLDSHRIRRVTPRTKTDRAEIEAELEEIRQNGFAEDHEEFTPGLCCIAVPFDEGRSPFALSLSAPSDRFAASRDEYLEQLRAAAELDASSSR